MSGANDIVTFRESDPPSMLAYLRAQNEQLKAEIAKLKGDELPPYLPQIGNGCRLCFSLAKGERPNDFGAMVPCFRGPAFEYEPAFNPNWVQRLIGRKPTPARMRRNCQFCKGVYYERTDLRETERN